MIRFFIALFCLILCAKTVNADDISAIKAAAQKRYNIPVSTTTGRSLVQWYQLRQSDNVSFHQAVDFLSNHSNWPDRKTIQKNLEQAITPSISDKRLIDFFNTHPPVSAAGMVAYLQSLLNTNQTAHAMQVLKNWWPKASITPNEQSDILNKFGRFLGSQDHERRLRHIIHDKHYTASRQLAKTLGHGYPQLIEAQIALIENKKNVNQLVSKVPTALRNNDAFMVARIQWRRKNDHDTGAIEMLHRAPSYNRMSNPKAWWRERHIMARRLMEQGKWGSAYALVKDHRQKDGFALAQAEFVAGWLALRKLGKPWEGFKHFEKLFNNVESPISRARGAYWAGLASETMNYSEIAHQWYRVAAKYQTTFYGQMAAGRIHLPLGLISASPIHITPEVRTAFRQNSLISATILLHRSGHHKDAKLFLGAYPTSTSTGADYTLVTELAYSLGYKDSAVKLAKSSERQGYLMPSYLFPVLPEGQSRRYAIHPAFNHAIMRQESAFDQYARSHAGALGLMQLMPATAKETAHKNGLSYSKHRLTNDPAYNMTLGSFYIKQMLDRFDGNRTLAIAAYNAGPGRVSRWIKEFGDPRDPDIDETDWIETIPVYETRNYVHRVSEALNVYAQLIQ